MIPLKNFIPSEMVEAEYKGSLVGPGGTRFKGRSVLSQDVDMKRDL